MKNFNYTVKDELGLHARPAGLLVKCASSCTSDMTISANGKTSSAKKLFGIMGLCVKKNDVIHISVSGDNELADCEKLKEFCNQNF